LKEAAADGFRSEQLGGSNPPPWLRALKLLSLHLALLDLGRLEEALITADELEPLARKIGHSLSVAFCNSTRVWIEFGKAPDLARLEAGFELVRKADQEASFPFLEVLSEVQLSLVDFFRGNWTSALLHAQASRRPEPGRSLEGFGVGTLFRQMTYAGDRNGALAILDEKRALLPRSGQPNSLGSWWMLALVIEGLVMLGEQAQAAQLYPHARELIGTGAVVLWPILHFTQTIAGVAASAAHQREAAEDHFQIAMQQAESFPNFLEQAEVRRFHAMMVLGRAAKGDREKARTLLHEALESYTQIGMPRHVEMSQALLD
jgi:tetratricopeptide (TPR) repeat protein